MTKYERITLWISGIALVLSVLTPALSYLFINPKIQELRNRKPLLVDQYDYDQPNGRMYELRIHNQGPLPVDNIKIVMSTTAYDHTNVPKPHPFVDPPSPFNLEMIDNVVVMTLQRSLGPEEKLKVWIPQIEGTNGSVFHIRDAHVYSDIGASIQRDHTKSFYFGGGKSGGHGASGSYE